MSGRRLEWNGELGRIAIRFRYDELLLSEVKSLPGRRWHPDLKIWSAPVANLGEVARVLLPLGFTCTSEVESLINGDATSPGEALAERVSEGVPGSPAGTTETTWTISELNNRAQEALQAAFVGTFWISGEVIGYERNRHKQHVFFTLAEKGEEDAPPKAQVSAVLFAGVHQQVEAALDAAGAGELADGVQLRVRARVDFYPPTGRFQIIIEEVDPEFTLGEIALRQEKILRQVIDSGVAELNLALPFPVPALRVALLTSLGSDAYNDVINELERSPYAFEVTIVDCAVQGKYVERDMTAALAHFARQQQAHDVVVICRGGGGRTDLMGFDSLGIAMAVARHPLKVMVGIGHHRDRSVLDFIATSEKTPTAVAQRLVALAREQAQWVEEAAATLIELSRGRIASDRTQLCHVGDSLRRGLHGRLEGAKARMLQCRQSLLRVSAQVVSRERRELLTRVAALSRGARRTSNWQRRLLAQQRDRFLRRATAPLRGERLRLEAFTGRLGAVDPRRLLARGYAWIRRSDGSTLRDVCEARVDEPLEATLQGGTIDVKVVEIHPDQEETAR